MLQCLRVQESNGRYRCAPHHKLSALPPIQWTRRKIYTAYEKISVQSQGDRWNPHVALMLFWNTPLGNGLQSQMELLHVKQARSDLPMSHAARMQVGKTAITRS